LKERKEANLPTKGKGQDKMSALERKTRFLATSKEEQLVYATQHLKTAKDGSYYFGGARFIEVKDDIPKDSGPLFYKMGDQIAVANEVAKKAD